MVCDEDEFRFLDAGTRRVKVGRKPADEKTNEPEGRGFGKRWQSRIQQLGLGKGFYLCLGLRWFRILRPIYSGEERGGVVKWEQGVGSVGVNASKK